MKNLFVALSAALLLMIGVSASATPPTEIAEQLTGEGTLIEVIQLQYDGDLKHIIFSKHGNLYIFAYAKWNGSQWAFKPDEVLEVFLVINQRPHVIWSRLGSQ